MTDVRANQVIDESASTNDDAKRLAEAGFPHGTWVSARKQTSGRGRLGRKWESVSGNLFLSVIARLEKQAQWSWVPLATAVAVAETLRDYDPRLDVRIKWPNDLWLGGAKLGGILCEAVGNREGSFIVIGLGLNCASAPEGLDQKTDSVSRVVPGVTADDLRMPVLGAVLSTLDDLQSGGFEAIRSRYEKVAVLGRGSKIEWISQNAGVMTATVEGLGESGELIVKTAGTKGESIRLYAEDVKVRVAAEASGGSPA